MQYSDRLHNLGTEMAFSVLQQIQSFPQERQENIISFAIGEPDFDTPEHIKNAAIESLKSNRTHYTPSAGIPELRQAIADYYTKERNFPVAMENVCVLSSAKLVVNFSILTCTNPGDEVIYPNPGYPVYESQARVFGCKPIPAPLIEEEEFGFDIDRLRSLITGKTRMIIINNPNNPCGSVLSSHQLEALREIALEHDLWIISDEIYSNLVYDGMRFRSIAELPDMANRTIILDGFSKYYAMTGWRLGFAIANQDVVKNFANWATNTISCSATFIQDAGVVAITSDKAPSNAMVQQFERRRNLMCELINDIEGISCIIPKGAFYVFANVTEACKKKNFRDATQFQQRLLDEQDVAVLSRDYFGTRDPDETQEYIRFSYCVSRDDIEKGIARIKKFIES
ncbi:MAG: pyridoxal phosphate-dependent aminotransferase [Candidatus Lokiarchaeota archaeon]|nr:pyridoxal phosphate-dependent aminotransferase [Candidatus Lokiarchaeota archaeon]